MHLLFHIVRNTHANGTHHKLALDALRHLKCTDTDYWQSVFLLHAKLYLEGATAPDDEFKDYKNHVLHTRDGFWGGAPDKVRSWYQHVVEALSVEDWPTAVYCAGVLSHYYTDALQPFHTAQSEAANNIHRAVERSVAKSYGALYALGLDEFGDMRVELGSDPNWLVELVCRGADLANGYYEKLIAHYDIGRGVVDPAAGLDAVARRIVAEMIRFAHVSYAAVLDRAIDEARVFAPEVGLVVATLLAVAQAPAKALSRRMANAGERRAIERMYDELLATGTVEEHLPDGHRLVRDLFAEEVLAGRTRHPQVSQLFPFAQRERVVTRIDRLREARQQAGATADVVPLHAPDRFEPAAATVPAAAASMHARNVSRQAMLYVVPNEPHNAANTPSRAGLADRLQRLAVPHLHDREPPQLEDPPHTPQGDAAAAQEAQFHLSFDHEVAEGPSIGAKTAKRLNRLGIKTVRDLLKAEPAALAVLLDARHVSTESVSDWQDQALLMCTIPGLRGTHAQLLVGAGYRTADAIAEAEADTLCAGVLSFAVTAAGQRILRNGHVPDIEKIKGWLEAARGMKAA